MDRRYSDFVRDCYEASRPMSYTYSWSANSYSPENYCQDQSDQKFHEESGEIGEQLPEWLEKLDSSNGEMLGELLHEVKDEALLQDLIGDKAEGSKTEVAFDLYRLVLRRVRGRMNLHKVKKSTMQQRCLVDDGCHKSAEMFSKKLERFKIKTLHLGDGPKR